LDTVAEFALLSSSTTPFIESADRNVFTTKSGILSSDLADAFLPSTMSTRSALSAMPPLRSTISKMDAVTVLKDTTRSEDRDAMESAHLYATSTKIGSEIDASASQDSSLSTTSALDALKVSSMMLFRPSAESDAELMRSTTSTATDVFALETSTSSRELVPDVYLKKPMTSSPELAEEPLVKVPMNT